MALPELGPAGLALFADGGGWTAQALASGSKARKVARKATPLACGFMFVSSLGRLKPKKPSGWHNRKENESSR
jgi:hypothetical protein